MQFESNSNLTWQITSGEKRERVQELVKVAWPALIILGVIAATIGYPGLLTRDLMTKGVGYVFWKLIYVVIGIGGGTLFLFILNKALPYKNRSYSLDESGLTIAKGAKQKHYDWNDFEYFYLYSRRYGSNKKNSEIIHPIHLGDQRREQIFESEREIAGEIFYLKQKPNNGFQKLYKVFVVVYSEPSNSGEVSNFLLSHLPKRQMTSASDLGLVFYRFK